MYTRVIEDGVLPLIDVGFVAAVKRGDIEIVPEVDNVADDEVLVGGARRLTPDAIVAATGYGSGLEPLVGHLGVLGERGTPTTTGAHGSIATPGLYFVGFVTSIGGTLRRIRQEASTIAADIAKLGRES